MCGIFGYISSYVKSNPVLMQKAFAKIQHRGPDRSFFFETDEKLNIFLGFHRLAIMDNNPIGDQPFIIKDEKKTIYSMTNGEIYNFTQLITKYDLEPKSQSDCESIPLIYFDTDINTVLKNIKGEFAGAIVDIDNETQTFTVTLYRDPFGVRPLFYAYDDETNSLSFASEMKALVPMYADNSELIKPFPPGNYAVFTFNQRPSKPVFTEYYSYDFIPDKYPYVDLTDAFLKPITQSIRKSLEESVISMLASDRPLGALLSGGLDSSLVVSIASKYLKTKGKKLNTFSIGMPGSTDEKYARMVSEFCDTNHTHIEFTTEQFLEAIEKIVYVTETYDVTTIRASTGQYLISEWISRNTDIKVLLIGDGSDEITSGYLYFHKAPTPDASHDENIKLLKELYLFDVLRADRGVASNGLEARVPYLATDFVETFMKIDPLLRIPIKGSEKWLLRKSFEGDYLPIDVLFRKKEAFSDGVSSVKDSWHTILQKDIEKIYTDDDLKEAQKEIEHCSPYSKEALYYRNIFRKYYKGCDSVIPHFWMPNWSEDVKDPSARILDLY